MVLVRPRLPRICAVCMALASLLLLAAPWSLAFGQSFQGQSCSRARGSGSAKVTAFAREDGKSLSSIVDFNPSEVDFFRVVTSMVLLGVLSGGSSGDQGAAQVRDWNTKVQISISKDRGSNADGTAWQHSLMSVKRFQFREFEASLPAANLSAMARRSVNRVPKKHGKAYTGKRNVARKVLSKTWRGCLQLHRRTDCSSILLRQRDLAQASGFFRECPGFEDDDASPATSVSDVCLLIPTSARLSCGARSLLPDVLLWLVGASRLPLGVAMVFVDQDLRPVKLRSLSLAGERRSRYDAVVAVRLLALSRYLLCEKLHAAVERWLWRTRLEGRQAFASQLLDGEAKEGFGFRDASASFKTLGARRGLARGLAELSKAKLQKISEALLSVL
eukprot:s158_g4.t1